MIDRVGQQLGNYRLLRLIGQGGFADVYLGEHIYLKTPAAIKVLQTHLAKDDLQGFLNEAQTIANLVHPNIVRVLEFGVEGDTPFLVMDYAPNGTLRQRHPRGVPVSPAHVALYIKQVAAALQHAHDQRLIHRDIKPENILLGRNNDVLLSDFGIAVIAQSSRYPQVGQEVGGTIAYMAPEQLQGKANPASDQYSLGIVVYEWLTGDRPFHGSFPEIASQHMLASPAPLRSKIPQLPQAVEEVVQRALNKDSQQRFMRIQAFANALEQASQEAQPYQSAPPFVVSSDQTPSSNFGVASLGQSSLPTYVTPQPRQAATPTPNLGITPPGQASSGNYGAVAPGQATPNFGVMQSGQLPSGNYGNLPPSQAQTSANFSPSAGQFLQTPSVTNNAPPKKGNFRRIVVLSLVVLVVLALAGGGLSWYVLSHGRINPLTQITPTVNPPTSTPLPTSAPTPTAGPTDTPTPVATDTPAPNATVTTTPVATPTVQGTLPPSGTLLYHADWSTGSNGWGGTSDWTVFNGELLNDGSSSNGNPPPTIVAPYVVDVTNDYSVEAKIRVVRGGPCFDAATVRGSSVQGNWNGYIASVCNGQVSILANTDRLTQTPFDPGTAWHTYRLEVKGTRLRLYVDGGLLLETYDNRFLNGNQVGLLSASTQLDVSSFKIFAL